MISYREFRLSRRAGYFAGGVVWGGFKPFSDPNEGTLEQMTPEGIIARERGARFRWAYAGTLRPGGSVAFPDGWESEEIFRKAADDLARWLGFATWTELSHARLHSIRKFPLPEEVPSCPEHPGQCPDHPESGSACEEYRIRNREFER